MRLLTLALLITLQTLEAITDKPNIPPPIDWSRSIISPYNAYIAEDAFRIRAPGERWEWEGPFTDDANGTPVHTLICRDPVSKLTLTLMIIDVIPEGETGPDTFTLEFLSSASSKIGVGDGMKLYNLKLFEIGPEEFGPEQYRFQANISFPNGREGFWMGYISISDRYYITQLLGTEKEQIELLKKFQNSLALLK